MLHYREDFIWVESIAQISVTSPIVIKMQTGELLAGETNNSFVSRFEHLNNKNTVCKQISSLFRVYVSFAFLRLVH